jgi:hypothetical protein
VEAGIGYNLKCRNVVNVGGTDPALTIQRNTPLEGKTNFRHEIKEKMAVWRELAVK